MFCNYIKLYKTYLTTENKLIINDNINCDKNNQGWFSLKSSAKGRLNLGITLSKYEKLKS